MEVCTTKDIFQINAGFRRESDLSQGTGLGTKLLNTLFGENPSRIWETPIPGYQLLTRQSKTSYPRQ